jgi:hypothetical protein
VSNDERQLWRVGDLECVMISCCAGAELQLRQIRLKPDTTEDAEILLRELYPTKSDLYERARDLRADSDQKEPRTPQNSSSDR